MSSQQDIIRRIRSVRNTEKITKAMELVAAAKMRRALLAMEASRPYAEAIAEVLARLGSSKLDATHPLLEQRVEVKNRLLILVTADRGLCGGLNTNAVRAANRFVQSDPSSVKLVTIGRKGRDYFRRFGLELLADKSMLPDRPALREVRPPITVAIDEFLSGGVDEVWLEYSRYVNAVQHVPVVMRVIPPELPETAKEEQSGGAQPLYEFEPSPEAVLEELLPRYVEAQVYQAVLENQASEQAAKMAAMRAASDNANELIGDLTLERNKLRQASITRELMEIVGGAEALAQAS